MTVAIVGLIQSGRVLDLFVPNTGSLPAYRVTVEQAAATSSYQSRDVAEYVVRLLPRL